MVETVKTIIEEDRVEVVNTIKKELKPVYSIKFRCKIQIQNWAFDVIGLIDTGCSNTVLGQKLVPLQYHQAIPSAAQFTAEQMDGKLFTYITRLDKCKVSFYLPYGRLINYINIDNQIKS